jgi:N-acetyl-gamma-glutamyl-phosphate/LysW-gamma-L-alpha-aminoadipyl-6-phosphate reductase
MIKVSIVGASGYTGGELIRILLNHPKVEISKLTSRQYAGEYVHRVHPNLRGLINTTFIPHNIEKVIENSDLVFTAVPHGKAVKIIPRFYESGIKVIDFSADFRLKNPKDYEKWYGFKHPYPDLLEKFVFGVPELHRDEIRNANYIANPGCMAVTSILALAPLIKEGLVNKEHIVIDAKIGSSGAGGKPSMATHFSERYNVVRPYKPVKHRHTAEIEQELSFLSNSKVKVSMSAHAVNMVRGILCTNHTFIDKDVSMIELWKLYRGFYKNEPFIRLIRDLKGKYKYPDPKVLIGSNFCDIGFELDEHSKRIVVLSATDNLMKGASGSAVQNMNVMMGYEETLGLKNPAIHPV